MKNIRERDEPKDDSAEFLMTISEAGLAWSELTALSLPDAPLSTQPKFSERCRCFSQNTAGDSHITQGMGSVPPYPRAQLFSVTRLTPQGSCPRGYKTPPPLEFS